MNPRRRVLLIAIASWAFVALRSHSANPFSGVMSVARATKSTVGVVAGGPLRWIWESVRWLASRLFPWARIKR